MKIRIHKNKTIFYIPKEKGEKLKIELLKIDDLKDCELVWNYNMFIIDFSLTQAMKNAILKAFGMQKKTKIITDIIPVIPFTVATGDEKYPELETIFKELKKYAELYKIDAVKLSKEAGAEIDLFYVAKKEFNGCTGCCSCWTISPGVCIQKDGMQEVYPKLQKADFIILASPLYCGGVTGQMKCFMDRLVLSCLPQVEIRNGRDCHPIRDNYKKFKFVLLSSCSFHSIANFDNMIQSIEGFVENTEWEFIGSILRPHARFPFDQLKSALFELGKQLVKTGKLEPRLIDTISSELIPLEEYVEMCNQ